MKEATAVVQELCFHVTMNFEKKSNPNLDLRTLVRT